VPALPVHWSYNNNHLAQASPRALTWEATEHDNGIE
jgi:hypothetical protein